MPTTAPSTRGRDPVQVVYEARQLIQSGAWQRIRARSDHERILTLLRARLPAALGLVPIAGLFALGKQPTPGGCHWCAALIQQLPDRAELERTPTTLALLGDGCGRCRRRWAAAQVAAREAAHVGQLVAAGFRPVAAARLRTPDQVAAYTASLRSLAAAQPPGRVPDPPYYRRTPRWPTT